MVPLAWVIVFLNAVWLQPASGQDAPPRTSAWSPSLSQPAEIAPVAPGHRSARADALLKGGAPLKTFNAVSLILERGHEVIVTDSNGKRVRGLISSISPDGLLLFRKRVGVSQAREELYRPDAIERIQVPDSHWNGLLLGLAVTVGSLFAVRACTGECQGTAAYAGLVGGIAPVLGWGIDHEVNAAVYERGRQPPQVSTASLSQRGTIGAVVRVGF